MALDLSNLRQLPGLSHRPNFPHDLHVLLLDCDFKARQEAEAQLRENCYSVTPCSCSVEAAAFLANPDNSCVDVILADVRCLQQKSAEHTAILQAAKSIPLILSSDSGAPSEVMLGIKLGAVDFLDKPLSPLKLKNIWQHLVRRLLSSPGAPTHAKKGTAASGTASPEDSGLQGGGSGSHSHGSGGESGSNASTSDQAPVKVECETDMETSSFQDALGCADLLPASTGHSSDMGAAAAGADFADCAPVGGLCPGGPCGAMQPEFGAGDGSKLRPPSHKYKASRAVVAAPSSSGGVSGGDAAAGACSSGGAPKPCIGYPAGQMPPLPAGVPGIEWGLPTNPLQISPKAGPGLLGPMGWPGGPLMGPPLFPSLFPVGSPSPSVASLPSMQHHPSTGGCGTMHLSASCLTLSSAAAGGDASGSNASCGGAAGPMKRAESAPLPALSCISNASAATGLTLGCGAGGDGLMLPPRAPSCSAAAAAGGYDAADLFSGMEIGKPMMGAPIGLQLKKSPSLLDFISQTLDGAATC